MSLPYYKRFPRSFFEGTIGMSFEVRAAYGLVLDMIYMSDGRLPDDPRYISGLLGCSVRKWNSIRSELIERGKLQCENGIISNFRADYLCEEQRKYQEKQSENRSKANKNSDLKSPPSPPKSDHKEEEEEKEIDKSISSAREAKSDHDFFEEAWKLYQSCKLKASAQKKKPAKDAWRAATGRCQPEQLLLAVRKAVDTRNTATGFFPALPHMHRWLQRDEWKDVLSDKGLADGETAPLTDDHWRSIFRTWCETGQWPTALAGPSPESPDCRAPTEMITTALEWKAGRAA